MLLFENSFLNKDIIKNNNNNNNNNNNSNIVNNSYFKWAGFSFILSAGLLPIKNNLTLSAMAIGFILTIIGFLLFNKPNININNNNFLSYFSKKQLYLLLSKSPITIISILLFLIILLSYCYSEASPDSRLKYILSYKKLLFLPAIMLIFYYFKQYQYWALIFLMSMISLIMILSIINYFLPLYFSASFKDGVLYDSYITHSHIIQNVFTATLALFILVCMRHQVRFSKTWFFLLLLFIAAVIDILFLVKGRTGQLVLLAEILLVAWLNKTWLFRLSILSFICLFIIILPNININNNNEINHTIYNTIYNKAIEGFVRTNTEIKEYLKTNKDTSAGLRIAFWKYSITKIIEKPLIGYGAGMYWKDYNLIEKYPDKPGYSAGLHHPHNQFLFLWHDAGISAFLLYIGFIMALIFQAIKTIDLNLKTMRFGVIISLIIYSCIDVPLYNSAEGMFYTMIIALFFEITPSYKNII